MSADLRSGRLTAPGEAAIAVFRLAGRRAPEVLARIFAPRGAAPLAPGQIRVGRLLDGGGVLDDAVVRVRATAGGWDAEYSVHGGVWIGERLEALLAEAGAAPLREHERWPEGRVPGVDAGDAMLAEAREGLLSAFAHHQVVFFLDALEGRLSREVRSIERSLAGIRGREESAAIEERLEALLRRAPLGLAMAAPPVVLLAGVPNSGKSTLFNALAGEARAIVSAEAGTTRDLVDEPVAIAGYPVRLCDSAGIRRSENLVERLGVARAEEARAAADIVVALIDPTADLEEQTRLADGVPRARRIVVVSKSDLPEAARRGVAEGAGPGALRVSARTGEGIDALRERIVAASPFGGVASLRAPAPFSAAQVAMLSDWRESVGARGRAAP